ncbi:MAG TPA: hypothetical protein VLM85_02620 [Polyangiaceae bacterium]|nr:hypothetical protein [Polyangiaceae bacterium]
MRFVLALALVALLALACGGRTQLAQGGGTLDATTPDAPADADECQTLGADLAEKATLAAACCSKCNTVQCEEEVEGTCCPLVVSHSNTPAVADYLSALAAYRAAGCIPGCPWGCPAAPRGSCGADNVCPEL